MEWIKVEDENPIDESPILLYNNWDDEGYGIIIGYYDVNYNTYKGIEGQFEVRPSHWCPVYFPEGDDE